MFNRLTIFMLPIFCVIFTIIHILWFDSSLTASASLIMLVLLAILTGINIGMRIMTKY